MVRDLNVKVAMVSGYSACDRPVAITWEEQELPISEVVREWREPGAKHYLVSVEDGRRFRLVFHESSGQWNILEVSTTKNK